MVCALLKSNKGHLIDWEKAIYQNREENWKGRKIFEALLINAQNQRRKYRKEGSKCRKRCTHICGAFNTEIVVKKFKFKEVCKPV